MTYTGPYRLSRGVQWFEDVALLGQHRVGLLQDGAVEDRLASHTRTRTHATRDHDIMV